MNTDADRSDDPCERVRGRLEALVDGSLDPLEAARDGGHLEACTACAALEAEARSLRSEVLRALGTPTDLDWLHAGLERRLEAAVAPRRSRLEQVLGPSGDRAGAPVLVAAAALLALIGLSASGLLDEVDAAIGAAAQSLDGLALEGLELEWPALPELEGLR